MILGIKDRVAGPSRLEETVGFDHCFEGCLKHNDLWNCEVSSRNRFRRVMGDFLFGES